VIVTALFEAGLGQNCESAALVFSTFNRSIDRFCHSLLSQ
jgi:hypothetical protein